MHKGMRHTEVSLAKMRAAYALRPDSLKRQRKGVRHTDETRAKIRAAMALIPDRIRYVAGAGRKRCRGCDRVLPVTEYSVRRKKNDGLNCYCKACARMQFAQWRSINLCHAREKSKARAAQYRADGRAQAYEAKNHEHLRQLRLLREKADRDALSDNYVLEVLGLRKTGAPSELIEAKRLCIQFVRVLKQEKAKWKK